MNHISSYYIDAYNLCPILTPQLCGHKFEITVTTRKFEITVTQERLDIPVQHHQHHHASAGVLR